MGIEDGAKQQYQHHTEDNKGKHIVIAVIKHQQDETQHNRGANPHDLHAGTCIETEDVGIAIRIAGTTDTYPPEREQGQVDDNRPPVY